ncbi:MAG: glycosyltransferase family 1 protein [Oscillospiraceae bacterium]|nr:glycosyltransferase family 1 protein [Oscillospiraceae bacterium]
MDAPIRVAHIMGKMMSGGVESVVMNYYRHIDRNAVQFDFIIDEDSSIVPYEEIENLGGKVYKIPPYQKPIAYHRALVKLFRVQNFRIVHSHINTMSVFPLFAAKRAKVPVRIAHSHSTAGRGELTRNILKYSLRPFSKVFPTHFCACSEHAGRWLFGDKLYDSGKVMLVRNAIDVSKFTFDPQIREAVRDELNVQDALVIIHVGRFMKQKNHVFLIDIFEEIHKRKPDSVLLLVGEGELEQKIRNKVKRLGLEENVRFLGVRDDVHRLLQAADVFLLPSLYEGLGMVAIEAQAVGLFVIASDLVPEETKITNNFLYTPLSHSIDKWVKNILSLSSNDRKVIIEQIINTGYEIIGATKQLSQVYERQLK